MSNLQIHEKQFADSRMSICRFTNLLLQFADSRIPRIEPSSTNSPPMPAKPLQPLLPVRYTQPELFDIDATGISIKDTRQHMEHPFFVLSTKPDTAARKYEDPNGNSIEVIPSSLGMPTILDKDVLIYAISHILHRKNRGEPISPRVTIYSSHLLRFANRRQSGRDYAALERALTRLAGCLIKTNIITGDTIETKMFSLLQSAEIQRKHIIHGRLMHCEVTLSDWLWRAIEANEVLTLHPDYFRLRRPLERRLYEIARKHCGRQKDWFIGLSSLKRKCASESSLLYFRYQIRKIASANVLPSYDMEFIDGPDTVTFRPHPDASFPVPSPEDAFDKTTWQTAKALAPDYDPRELNREWLMWRQKQGLPRPRHAPSAFLGFVKSFANRRQIAAANGEPPLLPTGETVIPKHLAWWNALPNERRDALEDRYRTYRIQDEDLFRSDASLITYSYVVAGPRTN